MDHVPFEESTPPIYEHPKNFSSVVTRVCLVCHRLLRSNKTNRNSLPGSRFSQRAR